MTWKRVAVAAATVAFIATVYFANWLVDRYGPIRVWPTTLLAPAGVYVVGLAFVLRDFVQYQGSRVLALAAIAVGTGLSVLVSPDLALASAAAFAASEAGGLAAFWTLQRRSLVAAVVVAGALAAAVDSYVFLSIAFGSLSFFEGQFVAKVGLSLLAAPLVFGLRFVLPRSELTPA
jgi:uncharacterized PurR-regulated membrane protein YhhQ (DUF165 family)